MRQIPQIVKSVWKTPLFRMDKDERIIYITFDDGPHPSITPEVLDILDDYQAKACFFCLGENVEKYPSLFEQIKKKGHLIGNHTYRHLDGYKTPTKQYLKDIEQANKWLKTKWFRPPYGRITPQQIKKLKHNYQIVLWDFMTYDYRTDISEQMILEEIKRRTRNGAIVLFHDSPKAQNNIRKALPKALQYWQEENYKCQTFKHAIG